jgi:hypothetical protein
MSEPDRRQRFEELEAGRVLGELDPIEQAEWHELSGRLGEGADAGLEIVAAALEIDAVERAAPEMPAELARRLQSWAAGMAGGQESRADPPEQREAPEARDERPDEDTPDEPPEQKVVAGPWTRGWVGWAVAACLLGVLVAQWMFDPEPAARPSDEQRLAEMIGEAPDLVQARFDGVAGDYAGAAGEVFWSDTRQEGYMKLSGVPVNDPAAAQYQLWIVDPERDEIPVDGGVFDVPPGGGAAVIPIHAKLPVSKPQAFVITLEQPGGVVRSKQDVVVALAKPV